MLLNYPDIMHATEAFSNEFGEQLHEHQRSPRNVTVLRLSPDGSLVAPIQSSASSKESAPRLLHLNVSAGEKDQVTWHLISSGDQGKNFRWDIDENGATELNVDSQGQLLQAKECDEETYDRLARLVCDMLKHPVTVAELSKLRDGETDPELRKIREELDKKGEHRTAKEDELLKKMTSLGIASVTMEGKMALIDRNVYEGRQKTT